MDEQPHHGREPRKPAMAKHVLPGERANINTPSREELIPPDRFGDELASEYATYATNMHAPKSAT
jgi:hypothetical protein